MNGNKNTKSKKVLKIKFLFYRKKQKEGRQSSIREKYVLDRNRKFPRRSGRGK
jgi:hypothetical protein